MSQLRCKNGLVDTSKTINMCCKAVGKTLLLLQESSIWHSKAQEGQQCEEQQKRCSCSRRQE
eukprot:2766225-Karenia_brevis.AAC.1